MDAEDFEKARELLEQLRTEEVNRMYSALSKSIKAQEERRRRRTAASKMEAELDQSIAEEVMDTVVVALCLVATVAPLVWIGESVELALSLMN